MGKRRKRLPDDFELEFGKLCFIDEKKLEPFEKYGNKWSKLFVKGKENKKQVRWITLTRSKMKNKSDVKNSLRLVKNLKRIYEENQSCSPKLYRTRTKLSDGTTEIYKFDKKTKVFEYKDTLA